MGSKRANNPINWDALYLSAEPETTKDAWVWLGMILSESPYSFTDYENEKRLARAHELFAWLEQRYRYSETAQS